jgi:hypothetical protein
MMQINIRNILAEIEKTPLNPAVGIRLALLWEDNPCERVGGKAYYGSLIAAGNGITPHYHNEGDEL